jgi:hypothetical protein
MINLKDARQVIAAAEAKAHELRQPMNIAVVDRPTPPTRAGSPICWCPTTRSVKYWWRRATWSRRLNPSATASPSESALGFVAAGAVAAWMLPLYGWRSLLWVGAISPLALAVFIYWFLPESIDFLVRNKADPRRIWTVLHRIDPLLTSEPPGDFLTDLVERKSAVGSLFQSGRTFGTLLLWVVFFLNLAEFYALQSWLPAMSEKPHCALGDFLSRADPLDWRGLGARDRPSRRHRWPAARRRAARLESTAGKHLLCRRPAHADLRDSHCDTR